MKKKMKSLRLKKLQIANLNVAYHIKGGTVQTAGTDCTFGVECTQSEPIITCTSIGQLKSLERVGAECKPEVVDSHEPSPSDRCEP